MLPWPLLPALATQVTVARVRRRARCARPQVINEAIVKGPLLDVCNDCSDKNIKGVDHKRTLEICDKWKYKISRDCGHDSFEQKTFFRTGHKCIGWIHYTVRGLLFPGGGLLAFVRARRTRAASSAMRGRFLRCG